MTKTYAAAAFTVFFSAAAALHGAFAQTNEAQFASEELGAKIANLTADLSGKMEQRLENMEAAYAAKLAVLDNAQPGRVRMGDNTRNEEAEPIVFAMAD